MKTSDGFEDIVNCLFYVLDLAFDLENRFAKGIRFPDKRHHFLHFFIMTCVG